MQWISCWKPDQNRKSKSSFFLICDTRCLFFWIRVNSAAFIFLFLVSYPLCAAPQKDKPIEASIGYDGELQIFRGQTKPLTLSAISTHGYDVDFQIITKPHYGTLSEPTRLSKGAISVFYTHSGKENQTSDFFQFKIKTGPQKAWSTKTAKINIIEPPARLEAQPGSLDFGSVFIGESPTQPLRISNAGGGILKGRLELTEPCSLQGPPDFQIASGKSKIFRISFAPKNPELQRGKIAVNLGSHPNPEIVIQGIGEARFEAPEKATFDQSLSPPSLQLVVTNKTPDQLPISIASQDPIIAPEKIELSGNGKSVLELKIKPGFFKEKFVQLSLTDGASTRLVKVQLPPPPPYFEWDSATQTQLGEVTSGRPFQITSRLHNLGTSATTIHIQAQGEGFSTSQTTSLTIPPSSFADVPATWTFNTPGPIEAALTATSGVISKTISFQAIVSAPAPLPTPRPVFAAVTAKSNIREQKPPEIKILSESEKQDLKQRLPSDPSYRLVPKITRADAIISWAHSSTNSTKFSIEYKSTKREEVLNDKINKRLQVAGQLPYIKSTTVWLPKFSKIAQLPDGRWQAHITGLRSGYHDIRISAQSDESTRADGIEFVIHVPEIPPIWRTNWILVPLFLVCFLYLIRRIIYKLFHNK